VRDNQVDTCRGNCGDGCKACSAKYEINFKPRDIRGDALGIEDPKLKGAG
jgi:hypothetical protein